MRTNGSHKCSFLERNNSKFVLGVFEYITMELTCRGIYDIGIVAFKLDTGWSIQQWKMIGSSNNFKRDTAEDWQYSAEFVPVNVNGDWFKSI